MSPKAPHDAEVLSAVMPLLDKAQASGLFQAARIAQAHLAIAATPEARQALESLVRSLYDAAGGTIPEVSEVSPEQRTLATLSLYIGEFEWRKLETEERETLADAVDLVFAEPGCEPMERWWQ